VAHRVLVVYDEDGRVGHHWIVTWAGPTCRRTVASGASFRNGVGEEREVGGYQLSVAR
jgi:hypothetical protein